MDRTVTFRQKVSSLVLVIVMFLFSSGTAGAINCYDCHGTKAAENKPGDYRPVDAGYRNITTGGFQGSHRNHMAKPGSPGQCAKCHPGSEPYAMSHRDGFINVATNINDSPSPFKARYKNITAPFLQTDDKSNGNSFGSCSNVNCHFESLTPTWSSGSLLLPEPGSPNGCTACHTSSANNAAPADGSHPSAADGSGKKHGEYMGTDTTSCVYCHTDHLAETAPFSHATSVGKRPLIVQFTSFPNSGGIYQGDLSYPNYLPSQSPLRNGDCSDLYCHSNGAPFDKANAFATVSWGGAATCTGCHGGVSSSTTLSGRHDSHLDISSYNYACERCHNDTVFGSDAIKDRSRHVMNRTKDIAIREGGTYNGDKSCSSLYCHSDARNNEPAVRLKWSDARNTVKCFSCHKGRASDSTYANCSSILGNWSSATQTCTPSLSMISNGHARLVGPQWIRKYPCSYCHSATVSSNGEIKDRPRHVDQVKDVVIDPLWNIVGKDDPSYDPVTRVCANVYCHSDGTTNPETVRPFAWTENKTNCNSCHGHPLQSCATVNCHDDRIDPVTGKKWNLPPIYGNRSSYDWPDGQKWKSAIPMFKNEGAGTPRANSHPRHVETDFTCDRCHFTTIKKADDSCSTPSCHAVNTKTMGEISHLEATFHVNRSKDVVFRNNSGTYNDKTKTCTNTVCHVGTQPQWGSSVSSAVICLDCHGSTGPAAADLDDYNAFNGTQGKINIKEWEISGHGRYSSAGNYPVSGNPPAKFTGNPCWYCHDNSILHKDKSNPFRLRMHQQFSKRFERECVYCHMEGADYECISCHYQSDHSLAIQMQSTSAVSSHEGNVYTSGCVATCHPDDVHKTGAGKWEVYEKEDVRNQYMMMGVCLQCHDDDSGGQCNSCHTPVDSNPLKFSLGFDPGMTGTRFIKPKKARASAAHFGYKHGRAFAASGGWGADGKPIGVWKGGKFCWDCHDPHGDKNIYMIHDKVATKTDGTYGIPLGKADVVFTRKVSGTDYAKSEGTINGICNVCHSPDPKVNKHYSSEGGDRHNSGRVCTTCHEHRFADSHANQEPCDSCHADKKPVPKHTAFGLPRDCVKCHGGIIGKRMDVMTQFNANSHHVQGVPVTNKQCYQCHWESTKYGLIDITYHEGYNYKNYTSVKNAYVDLVINGPKMRPTVYKEYSTAIRFLASNMSAAANDVARKESEKINSHCISCHSDQNNDYIPFDDCKTPRQYAWDFQSIDSRYSQAGVATWGKYPSTPGAAPKNISKALSAHGNAKANAGGFSTYSGVDGTIPNTRGGSYNVTCYDCHSSHGSAAVGVITSYLTFNNTYSGGNLKETQAGKGGYTMKYKAEANPDRTGINPYNTGAAQCFDCHNNRDAGITPWGYNSTFEATSPIMGYRDTTGFGQGIKAVTARYPERASKATIRSSHFKSSSDLKRGAAGTINGICTPCHDPHGVSPTLKDDQAYAVPLLKGTWMTSPYKDDSPPPNPTGDHTNATNNGTPRSWGRYETTSWSQNSPTPKQPVINHYIDRNTFGGTAKFGEEADKFAGLCLVCHSQANLVGGSETAWGGLDKVHKAVKGWGGAEHSFTCSKCHQPHNSGLPRLMKTNCLDAKHRGNSVSSGEPWAADKTAPYAAHNNGYEHRGFPIGSMFGGQTYTNPTEATTACHVSRFNKTYNNGAPPAEWPSGNLWNNVTPW